MRIEHSALKARRRGCDKIKDKGGETLFEVVLSIALFSIMALMVATMFVAADRATLGNLRTDEAFDKAVTDIVTGQNITTKRTMTVRFQNKDGSTTADREVELIEAGGLYKFR